MRGAALYPFVPSGPAFETSIAFFLELGFSKEWQQDGLAGLRFGGAYFMLQQIDVPEWQRNQMIVLEVDDLDGWWSLTEAKKLGDKFAGVRMNPPKDFPWGREVHLIDPAGVCWHVRQSSK
jgi:hypothetical protein